MGKAATAVGLVLAVVAIETACGGAGQVTGASDVSTLQTAQRASLSVAIGEDATTGPSLDPTYARYLRFTSVMTESAGVGATLDDVRGEFFRSSALVERYEVSGAELGGPPDITRIEARSSQTVPVMLRWSASCDQIRVTFHFTDDRGHEHFIANVVGSAAAASAASTGDAFAAGL